MKRLSFVFLVCLLVLVGCSCSVTKKVAGDNLKYRIRGIKSNELLHIIDAERGDTVFCVISFREVSGNTSDEIKVGSSYPLKLTRIYPVEGLEDVNPDNNFADSCFIEIDRKTHYSLYVAKNLSGLRLTKSAKSVDSYKIQAVYCDACKDKNKILLRLFVK